MRAHEGYRKGAERRLRIVSTAHRIIVEEGLAAATARTIASRAGVTESAIFHYFPTMDELLLDVVRDEGEDSVMKIADLEWRDIVAGSRFTPDSAGMVDLRTRLTLAAGDQHHPAHDLLRDCDTRVSAELQSVIVDAQARGELSRSISPSQLSDVVLALVVGLQLQWRRDPTTDVEGLVRVVLQRFEHRPRP